MREQLLDAYNISYGVLEPLLGGNTSRNLDEAAALCAAMNDWQAHDFVDEEPRLRASILVPQDDPEASVKEIEKRAGDWRFAQIQLGSKTLLADLCRGAGEWAVDRVAYRWHAERRAVSERLAAILHRGSSCPGPLDAEPGGEFDS
jgi:hypothetical protein